MVLRLRSAAMAAGLAIAITRAGGQSSYGILHRPTRLPQYVSYLQRIVRSGSAPEAIGSLSEVKVKYSSGIWQRWACPQPLRCQIPLVTLASAQMIAGLSRLVWIVARSQAKTRLRRSFGICSRRRAMQHLACQTDVTQSPLAPIAAGLRSAALGIATHC